MYGYNRLRRRHAHHDEMKDMAKERGGDGHITSPSFLSAGRDSMAERKQQLDTSMNLPLKKE
ncbi:MAG: hypothetical protein WAU05_03960, partial [Nitrospira sp.]